MEKSFGTSSFNIHVTLPETNLEKPTISQDISMNFHENLYREIKRIRPESNGKKNFFKRYAKYNSNRKFHGKNKKTISKFCFRKFLVELKKDSWNIFGLQQR